MDEFEILQFKSMEWYIHFNHHQKFPRNFAIGYFINIIIIIINLFSEHAIHIQLSVSKWAFFHE